MLKRLLIFAVIVAAYGTTQAQTTATRTKTHVETLASGKLEGRVSGS